MFKNVGKKIMSFAKVYMVLGIIAAVLWSLISLFDEEIILAVIWIAAGFGFILSAWMIYAFGQIVDDVHRMTKGDEVETVKTEEIPEL